MHLPLLTTRADSPARAVYYSTTLAGVVEAAWEADEASQLASAGPAERESLTGAERGEQRMRRRRRRAERAWGEACASGPADMAGIEDSTCGLSSAAQGVGMNVVPSQEIFVFHGVCSWGPGQLEGELQTCASTGQGPVLILLQLSASIGIEAWLQMWGLLPSACSCQCPHLQLHYK